MVGRDSWGSVATAATASHAAATEAGFAGKVSVVGHRGAERVEAVGHHRAGQGAAFVGLDPDQRRGTGGEQEGGGEQGGDGFHGRSFRRL